MTTERIKPSKPATGPDQVVINRLKTMGFSNVATGIPHRLVAAVSGKEGTGKTHMLFTAPEPIFLFNIDIGTEGVLEKFQVSGKDIYVYDVRIPKGAKKEVYETLWHDVKERVEWVYKVNEGTLGADTSTEMYELARLAHFGKLTQVLPHNYVEVKSEWREILRMAYDSRMNTILLNKVKPVYINNTRTKEYEIAGFDEMAYMVQVAITTFKEPVADGGVQFGFTIDKCRYKPSLFGQEFRMVAPVSDSQSLQIDPIVNFPFLLDLVHGS